jgi:hypothetical protein
MPACPEPVRKKDRHAGVFQAGIQVLSEFRI